MKKILMLVMALMGCVLFAVAPVWAGSMSHGDMSHDNADQGAMSHAGHQGKMIHESTVDGYRLAYHLIDMKEKMKGMKMEMTQQMGTHHLMVFIQSPDGHPEKTAKVGYVVAGPDNTKQKVMAMGMSDGFGADVTLKEKGTYTVKTKAVVGSKKLLDTFEYAVK
jgi:hypothetical protein